MWSLSIRGGKARFRWFAHKGISQKNRFLGNCLDEVNGYLTILPACDKSQPESSELTLYLMIFSQGKLK
jgi:hypothetical protein